MNTNTSPCSHSTTAPNPEERRIPFDPPTADELVAKLRHRSNTYEGALADVERLLRVMQMAIDTAPPEQIEAADTAALALVVTLALNEIASAWKESETC